MQRKLVVMLFLAGASAIIPFARAAGDIVWHCSGNAPQGVWLGDQRSFCSTSQKEIPAGSYLIRLVADPGAGEGWIHGGMGAISFSCNPALPAGLNGCALGGLEDFQSGRFHMVAEFNPDVCALPCAWSVQLTLTPS